MFVLLCKQKVEKSKKFLLEFESQSDKVLMSNGPDGQLKGCHMQNTLEELLMLYNPLVYKSVCICKPASAKPTSAVADIHLFANLDIYAHITKESNTTLEVKRNEIANTISASINSISTQELSLDELKQNAHQLFRMFDVDRSGAIDFEGTLNKMKYYVKNFMLHNK